MKYIIEAYTCEHGGTIVKKCDSKAEMESTLKALEKTVLRDLNATSAIIQVVNRRGVVKKSSYHSHKTTS